MEIREHKKHGKMVDMKDENTDYFIIPRLILVSYNSLSACWGLLIGSRNKMWWKCCQEFI